jgi:hypothetical protein
MTNRLTDQSGSILATVLVVLIILLSIFLSAMTYALSRYSHHVVNQNKLVASHLADAGIAHALAQLEDERFRADTVSWQAPNRGEITTELDAWGPYVRVRSRGCFGNQTIQISALIGTAQHPYQQAAVTVCGENNPLVIAGRTRIIGDVNTGSQGIMEGRFRGKGIAHKNYLIGRNHKRASLDVPRLDTTVYDLYKRSVKIRRRQIETRLPGSVLLGPEDSDLLEAHDVIRIENNLELRDLVFQNWSGTKSIFVDGSVEIKGRTRLSGFIEIVSNHTIIVGDSAVIDNIILTATDSVVIADNARSSAVVISQGKIIVGDRATLVYPSLLLADVTDDPNEPEGGIYLRSRRLLESVAYVREKPFQFGSPDRLLYLDTLARYQGVMIAQGYTDLRGRLEGSAVTDRFHFNYPPTTYVNWLKDAHIDRSRLDFTPVLPALEPSDSTGSYYVLRQDRVD